MIDLLAVVITYNNASGIGRSIECLHRAMQQARVDGRIVVVDNASSDDTVLRLKALRTELPLELLEPGENLGFGRAINGVWRRHEARYVLLANPDAFVAPNAIRLALAHLDAHRDVGVVGARLISPEGMLQPSCRFEPTPLSLFRQRTGLQLGASKPAIDDLAWDHATVRDCDWVPGCFFLLRTEAVRGEVLFDERFFMYYEEVDLCRRLREEGWRIQYLPDVLSVHIGGESAKSIGRISKAGRQLQHLVDESEQLYFRKWFGVPGMLLNLLLTSIVVVKETIGGWIRGRRPEQGEHPLRALGSYLGTLQRTRFGTTPTR
ncbi:MAG: glycosyltransferase family 2 protein [Pseudomonadales bacterium]|jgi:GT2 family glycosyltransferase|nr:glycosyltransferase family 2 protein [Pseudomonadales bacterium]